MYEYNLLKYFPIIKGSEKPGEIKLIDLIGDK